MNNLAFTRFILQKMPEFFTLSEQERDVARLTIIAENNEEVQHYIRQIVSLELVSRGEPDNLLLEGELFGHYLTYIAGIGKNKILFADGMDMLDLFGPLDRLDNYDLREFLFQRDLAGLDASQERILCLKPIHFSYLKHGSYHTGEVSSVAHYVCHQTRMKASDVIQELIPHSSHSRPIMTKVEHQDGHTLKLTRKTVFNADGKESLLHKIKKMQSPYFNVRRASINKELHFAPPSRVVIGGDDRHTEFLFSNVDSLAETRLSSLIDDFKSTQLAEPSFITTMIDAELNLFRNMVIQILKSEE